jgi:hypothetical protein
LAQEARDLDRVAQGLQSQANDLSRRATGLRAKLDAYVQLGPAAASHAGADKSAADAGAMVKDAADSGPNVDFIKVWPPTHKAHAWCRIPGGLDKGLEAAGEEFDEDENKLLEHYEEVAALGPDAGGDSKSTPDEAWWWLPDMLKSLGPNADDRPLAPDLAPPAKP